jgi:hypothetical protein
MYIEEKFFTITRESIGLEPIVKRVDHTNSNHKIKNCGLRIRECQKFLELTDEQVRNGIKINILKSVTISETLYICIQSAQEVKNDNNLIEKILDEDELTTNIAANILEVSTKNVRRLIEEGYLTVTGTFEFKYGVASLVKRGEVRKLKPQISEIKEFWKSQARINRQLGAKKAAKTRKTIIKEELSFKDKLFSKFDNTPHKQARLIKACLSLLALNYYIERKMNKKIVDKELLDLRTGALKKLIGLYKNSEYLKIFFVQGEKYIHYCPQCLEDKLQYKDRFFILNNDKLNLLRDKKQHTCPECQIDQNYFSVVFFLVQVFEYTFLLNCLHREIKEWFSLETIPHKKISSMQMDEDRGLIENININKAQLRSFKLYEIISFLKDFINSKDPDFSFNL